MGILVEFNPDLALRNITDYDKGLRKKEECIPPLLEKGKTYAFLKEGQRNYWLMGEIPLVETAGGGRLSRPKASVIILEATHILLKGVIWTKGKYKVIDVFDPHDVKIHFDGFSRIV